MECCGKERPKGYIFSASFYNALIQANAPSFPWKRAIGVPFKVAFFVWTVSLGSILTVDNLIFRKRIFVNWCCMCKRDGVSVSHLLLHCSMAKDFYGVWLCLCLE